MSTQRSHKVSSGRVGEDFQFIMEDREMDEGQLSSFEVLTILKGDLEPLNLYMDELAYKNLDYRTAQFRDPQIGKLIKTQQLAVQYLKYKLALNQTKTQILHEHTLKEEQNQAQLEQFKVQQNELLKDLQRKDENADYLLSMHDEMLKKQRHREKIDNAHQAAGSKKKMTL